MLSSDLQGVTPFPFPHTRIGMRKRDGLTLRPLEWKTVSYLAPEIIPERGGWREWGSPGE